MINIEKIWSKLWRQMYKTQTLAHVFTCDHIENVWFLFIWYCNLLQTFLNFFIGSTYDNIKPQKVLWFFDFFYYISLINFFKLIFPLNNPNLNYRCMK